MAPALPDRLYTGLLEGRPGDAKPASPGELPAYGAVPCDPAAVRQHIQAALGASNTNPRAPRLDLVMFEGGLTPVHGIDWHGLGFVCCFLFSFCGVGKWEQGGRKVGTRVGGKWGQGRAGREIKQERQAGTIVWAR